MITWVDGADPQWQKEKLTHMQNMGQKDLEKNSESRYRDMELLKYWFRGVEQFAPWVNKIHFITCGQVPSWLNTEHEKLNIVNHWDYLDEAHLPTFNSNAIELKMHQIKGLSEYFVYFNDDMFLTAPVKETDFFRKNLPCDFYELKAIISYYHRDSIDYIRLNNTGLVNRHYSGRKRKLYYFWKKFSLCYSLQTLCRNAVSLIWRQYLGFGDPHLPISYRKSDFESMWKIEAENLLQTCSHKFRTPYDISHWVFRYARLVSGNFEPVDYSKFAKYYLVENDANAACDDIAKQKFRIMCINDNEKMTEFDKKKLELNQAFEAILPEKSRFEY